MQCNRIKCRWKEESDLIGRCKLASVCNEECLYTRLYDSERYLTVLADYNQLSTMHDVMETDYDEKRFKLKQVEEELQKAKDEIADLRLEIEKWKEKYYATNINNK